MPSELNNIIGKQHIFQIQFAANSQKGSGHFIVNDILDLPNLSHSESQGTSIMTQDLTQRPQNLTEQSVTSRTITNPKQPCTSNPRNKCASKHNFVYTIIRGAMSTC